MESGASFILAAVLLADDFGVLVPPQLRRTTYDLQHPVGGAEYRDAHRRGHIAAIPESNPALVARRLQPLLHRFRTARQHVLHVRPDCREQRPDGDRRAVIRISARYRIFDGDAPVKLADVHSRLRFRDTAGAENGDLLPLQIPAGFQGVVITS